MSTLAAVVDAAVLPHLPRVAGQSQGGQHQDSNSNHKVSWNHGSVPHEHRAYSMSGQPPPAVQSSKARLAVFVSCSGSLRVPQLIAGRRDRRGDGARDQLLVIGRGQLHDVRALRRDFNRDRRSSHIVQWAQRSRQIPHRNLPLLQLTRDQAGSALAHRKRDVLGRVPRTKWPAIIAPERKQRGVDTHSPAAGRGVKGNINRCVIRIGENRALIDRKVRVGVPKHERGDAPALQLLTQAARQRNGYILFQKRIAKRFSVIISTMACINYGEVAPQYRSGRGGHRRSLHGLRGRGCRCRGCSRGVVALPSARAR